MNAAHGAVVLGLLAAAAWLAGLGAAWSGRRGGPAVGEAGLPAARRRPGPGAGIPLALPPALAWLAGVSAPLGRRAGGTGAGRRVARQLVLAGADPGLTPDRFLGLQAAVAGGGALLALALNLAGAGGALVSALLPLAGWWGPGLWLQAAVRKRQEAVARDLPDLLDGLAVGLAAGAAPEQALRAVCHRLSGPLAGEFRQALREMDVGMPREQAFRRLTERVDCPDARWLVQALLHALPLGVPLAGTLGAHARHLRSVRLAAARERAARSGPWINLVTVFVLTPAALLLLLGTIFLNLWYRPEQFGLAQLFGF